MRIQILKLYTRSFDLDHLDVFWEPDPSIEFNPIEYEFSILRSESPAGPFDLLAGPFQDRYHYRDQAPPELHKWRRLYYLLRIRHKPTDETKDFGPTAQVPEADLIALEIQRHHDLLYRNHAGRVCWVFPIRTFGQKCVCYSKIGGRRDKSKCATCYDSGYLGGFLRPIAVPIQIDSTVQQGGQLIPQHEQQVQVTTAKLGCFPPIKPKDIIVELENKRWRVVGENDSERLRSTVSQRLTISRIHEGDIEFKLPVNLDDLRNLQVADERNFTNPQHADAQGELPDLLAVYGYGPRGGV